MPMAPEEAKQAREAEWGFDPLPARASRRRPEPTSAVAPTPAVAPAPQVAPATAHATSVSPRGASAALWVCLAVLLLVSAAAGLYLRHAGRAKSGVVHRPSPRAEAGRSLLPPGAAAGGAVPANGDPGFEAPRPSAPLPTALLRARPAAPRATKLVATNTAEEAAPAGFPMPRLEEGLTAVYRPEPERTVVGVSGSVLVSVQVAPDGTVASATAREGDGRLIPPALAAARQWRFLAYVPHPGETTREALIRFAF